MRHAVPAVGEGVPHGAVPVRFTGTAAGCQWRPPWRLRPQDFSSLTAPLQHVPLRTFRPHAPTRFYVAPGLVLYVADSLDDGKFDLWAGRRHTSQRSAGPPGIRRQVDQLRRLTAAPLHRQPPSRRPGPGGLRPAEPEARGYLPARAAVSNPAWTARGNAS
ncbi:hypothetical protein SHO565_74190 [Streptomyces sp. HO565]